VDDRTTITVPETTAQTPMGLAVLPERHRLAISPLNRRRWLNFKANQRGHVAFWIFMVLFVISLAFMGVDGYMEQMQQFQQQIESNS